MLLVGRLDYPRQVMVAYVIAMFMTVIDGTMVNVALATMAHDFDVQTTDVEWIAIGYLLAVAAVIPAAGWLSDRFGGKRIFVAALVAFTVASLLCGLSQSLEQLVALRVVQGLAGGLMIPIGSAMLFRAFPLHQRATAAAGVLSVAVVAPAIGPGLGGLIVDHASWRWIFLINLPIGVIGTVISVRVLRDERHGEAGRFDLAGFVLCGGSIALLIYTMSIAPDAGWTSLRVLGLAVLGAAGVVAAILVELRVTAPMLALRLFRDRLFRAVNISSPLVYAGFFGMIYVLPIYLQSVRGYSAFTSGLTQCPQAIGVLVVSNTLGKRWYAAYGPRRLMAGGTAVAAIVTCAFAWSDLDTPLWQLGSLSFVRGLAMGIVFICVQTAVYATTTAADTARAASLFNTSRQVAYASGVALAATVMSAGLRGISDAAPAAERLPAYQHAFLAVGLVMVPAIGLALLIRDEDVAGTRSPAPTEPTRAMVD